MNYKNSERIIIKVTFTIVLLSTSMILQGQDSIARIKNWSGFNFEYEYYYSLDSKLDSLIEFSNGFQHVWKYSNDTLVSIKHPNYTEYFIYTEDTVFQMRDNEITWKFDVNNENCYLFGGNYTWEDGNCTAYIDEWYATYYEQYKNPWLHGSYYLRRSESYGLFSGNLNLVNNKTYPDFEYFHMSVIEAIDEWPTLLNYSWNTGSTTITIEYYDWVHVDVKENLASSETILFTEYYDIIGRQISKPKRGFYIERKTTNKRVISKKYYIQ